ncbi:MAG: sensor histidine kinase [Nocardioides sp.]
MRERLAGAFVLLAVAVLVLVVTIRTWALDDLVRDQEQAERDDRADLIASVLVERVESGGFVTAALLTGLVDDHSRLEYVGPDGESIVATGGEYAGSEDPLSVELEAGDGRVLLTSDPRDIDDVSSRQFTSMLMLALLVTILAGLAGWWLAARLTAPFAALAGAAAALGRGRFDLTLPDTRIPEAQAIGQALKVSAAQIESRLARERDFAEYASHELRTPLTALHLELEDLTLRDDVPEDAKAAARRCLQRVDDVNAAAGELVSITRQGALVEGGAVALSDLATHVTQMWADRLADDQRTVTAHADGDLDATFTPGPVEQVLELVLDDIVGGSGPVRLRFVGDDSHVRVTVPPHLASPAPHPGLTEARQLAESQGGRITGDLDDTGLDILLPRR